MTCSRIPCPSVWLGAQGTGLLDGRKRTRPSSFDRLIRVVATPGDIREGLTYAIRRRVIELPVDRHRTKVAVP